VIGLLQRVRSAHVEVDGLRIAEINAGLLVLVGVQQADSRREVTRLLEPVCLSVCSVTGCSRMPPAG